jgi:uncharacterized membrane protein
VENTKAPPQVFPDHVEETVRSIARLRAEHHEDATPLQRFVAWLTGRLARPRVLGVISFVVVAWIGLNLTLVAFGDRPVDPPPFAWLTDVVSVVSLYMVVLILGAQRHEEQLALRREMLILEMAILSEQKIAKVIALLEEIRRDNPLIRDRHDPGAETLAQPADPQSVLEAIKQAESASSK